MATQSSLNPGCNFRVFSEFDKRVCVISLFIKGGKISEGLKNLLITLVTLVSIDHIIM